MSFLKGTINDVPTLEADVSNTLTWYINIVLSVHANMKSCKGEVFTMGKGEIISSSTEQKVNVKISTESKLIGVD